MGLKDAVAEKGVGGVDGAAEAEGGVNPMVGVSKRLIDWGSGDSHRRSIVEVIPYRIPNSCSILLEVYAEDVYNGWCLLF